MARCDKYLLEQAWLEYSEFSDTAQSSGHARRVSL